MDNQDWRQRLADKIMTSNMSMREISLAAGRGEGYVFSILKDAKEPSVSALAKICQVIGTSVSYILYGYEMTGEEEEFLTLFAAAAPEERAAILTLLKAKNVAK